MRAVKQGKQRRNSKTQPNNLFMGGIPLDTTRAELLNLLERFDAVLSLEIAQDQITHGCKGFAKATLQTPAGVDRLLSVPKHYIRGLEIGVKRWMRKGAYLKNKDQVSKRKIFVKHHPCITADELFNHFSWFGQIESVDSKNDPFTNKPRNFTYIVFSTEEEAITAAKHGSIFDHPNYIYCQLTIPSYLMGGANSTSPCLSPTFHVPTKSTKQKTRLSFEHFQSSFGLGSIILDGCQDSSPLLANRVGNATNSWFSAIKKINQGSLENLSQRMKFNTIEERRQVETCQNFEISELPKVIHESKPTSRNYSSNERVQDNHHDGNLAFKRPRIIPSNVRIRQL